MTDEPIDSPAQQHIQSIRHAFPGLLTSVTVAMAAMFLANQYDAPVMLFALLLGMAFNFLSEPGAPCQKGIELASKSVLRLGVALLGVRITFEQILSLGAAPIITVLLGVAITIGVGWIGARLLGLERSFGLLSGGAVAICGASAALAISAVLPRDASLERNTIFTVIGVTTLSTIAMVLYPLLSTAFGLDEADAGLFLGATIHDVAQVVGAGYSLSDTTGDIATYTKLLRVAMLLPVVFIFSMVHRGSGEAGALPLPPFLIAFAILVVVNSIGLVPDAVAAFMFDLSRWCLVSAIAALGMKTSFKSLAALGFKPVALIVAETVILMGLVLGLIVAVF